MRFSISVEGESDLQPLYYYSELFELKTITVHIQNVEMEH